MPQRVSIEDRLLRLRQMRDRADLVEIRGEIGRYLDDRCNLVVAEACKIVGQLELSGMEPTLLDVWKRLIEVGDPIKADKGCVAKTALVEALGQLSYDDADFYMSAISYQQIEPAWPAPEDTAGNTRATAAYLLARSRQLRIVDKLNAFVGLMAGHRFDRMTAVQAIADTGHESSIPLLRLILQMGVAEVEVLGACMTSLLSLAPESSIDLVARFMTSPDETLTCEAAAALGLCGHAKAVRALINSWKSTANPEFQQSLLFSIGLSRDPTAFGFLITQLETADDVETVLDALKPASVYDEKRLQIREILIQRGLLRLLAEFDRKSGRTNSSL